MTVAIPPAQRKSSVLAVIARALGTNAAPLDPEPYSESREGGHHGPTDNAQRAYEQVLVYTFLADKLRLGH